MRYYNKYVEPCFNMALNTRKWCNQLSYTTFAIQFV